MSGMPGVHLSVDVPDSSPPRPMNAQVVILEYGHEDGLLRVLIQKRSNRMSVMPGYLGAVGGMRDRSDADSRATAYREMAEETGLTRGIALHPSKFAEGAKVDWYVMRLENPVFAEKAPDQWECGDIGEAMPFLPPTSVCAACHGHAWVPVADLHMIHSSQKLMGGLIQRIREAVHHIGLGSQLFRTQGEAMQEIPHDGRSDMAQCVSPKGRGKAWNSQSAAGKDYATHQLGVLTVERAQSLPRTMLLNDNLVAFQLCLGTPWRAFGPGGETFNWEAADTNSVSDNVKSHAKALLQAYAKEHDIPVFGQSFVRIAVKQGDFWVSLKGGVAHVRQNMSCPVIVIDE